MLNDDNCRCANCIAEDVIAESVAGTNAESKHATEGWIGVDLDRTLAVYTNWVSVLQIGEPIWPMVHRVQGWLDQGKRVKIMTARLSPLPKGVKQYEVIDAIQAWCLQHIGTKLEVTNMKDMYMIELWDDRAVQVEPNVGEPVTYWSSRVA
jgi:hypothetical protein